MIRLLYLLYRLEARLRQSVQRRLTPTGALVLFGLVMSAGIGSNAEATLAGQAFALLFCVWGTAVLSGWFFRGRFEVERMLPRYGTVGEPLRYTVRVRNLTRRNQRGLGVIESQAGPAWSRDQFARWLRAQRRWRRGSFKLIPSGLVLRRFSGGHVELPTIPAGGVGETKMACVPYQRGPLRLAGLDVTRADPLGIWRGRVHVTCPQTVMILPRRYRLPEIALPGTRQYQLGGVALAQSVGQSEEFIGVREYRRGDPLRHIHWRSWAKAGRPIVKEFTDEFFVRHALVLDTFAGPERQAAFEEAVSVAASFACTVQDQESLLDLLFVGPHAFCFTAGRGVAHADQMLEVLAAVERCESQSFEVLEALVLGHAEWVSGCICVLLEWDEPRRRLVRRLQALGRPVLAMCVSEPPLKRKGVRADEPLPDRLMDESGLVCHILRVGRMGEDLLKIGPTATA